MNLWVTENAKVVLQHGVFTVYNLDDEKIGTIVPGDGEALNTMSDQLDDGECPIADAWEDGAGNTCTIEGWGGGEIEQ
jgi:hypothetical protein